MVDEAYIGYVDSESDDGMGYESPEADEELFLTEFVDKKLANVNTGVEEDVGEIDFELEMQRELDAAIKFQYDKGHSTGDWSQSASKIRCSKLNKVENESIKTEEVYDDDYFSSGSEDGNHVAGEPSKSKQRRKVLSNEELFYDPKMDDNDEKWVINQRQLNSTLGEDKNKNAQSIKQSKPSASKAPSSDAILSCPACLVMLCIDCQRHEVYKNQYRAMFVMNCKVVKDETLRYNKLHKHIGKRKQKQKGKLVAATMETIQMCPSKDVEIYHPVKCSECGTEVAVFDCDEVYHFFDVLTSYA